LSEHQTQPLPAESAPARDGVAEDYATEQYWDPEPNELPPRRRRRLITPLTGALLGVLLVGCGFVGGVLAEKGQVGGTTAASPFAGRAAGARAGGGAVGGGPAAALGGQSGSATVGQVSTVRGRTLYVQDTQGNTVKVALPKGANVIRTTTSGVGAIHPGDTVIVQGSQGANGTVNASSVRATAAGASATAGGRESAAGSGGGSGAVGQLFGDGQSSGGGSGQAGRAGNGGTGGG
jgi:hypothetical protein